MEFKNLTPHTVRLNGGQEFQPSGEVARVTSSYSGPDESGVYTVNFGRIVGLPEPIGGVLCVVSALVAQAAKRADVVSPATGHPECIRRDGQVYSVPGFVRSN